MHNVLPVLCLVACLAVFALPARSLPAVSSGVLTGFIDKTISIGGDTLRYVVFVPPGYDPSTRWPTIVFLHGKGECGRDGARQLSQGLGRAIMQNRERWPCIVLFPQKPDPEKQWKEYDEYVMGALAATELEYATDPRRTSLTGLSQGGHGTWMFAAKHPQRWSAIAPICGYGDPAAIVPNVKGLPIRCYHGGADDVVKPEQSRRIVAALREAGAAVDYTEYEGVNHNSWDRAYAEHDLARWLIQATGSSGGR